jgi:hypothetical protein
MDWKDIRTDLIAFLGADVVKAVGGSALKKVAESASPMDMKYFRLRITGQLALEDEHIVELAEAEILAGINPNAFVLAEQKLATLEDWEQDYVRLVAVGFADPGKSKEDDEKYRVAEVVRIYTMYAMMDDVQWNRHVVIMNFKTNAAKLNRKFLSLRGLIGGVKGTIERANKSFKKVGLAKGARKAHDSFASWADKNV